MCDRVACPGSPLARIACQPSQLLRPAALILLSPPRSQPRADTTPADRCSHTYPSPRSLPALRFPAPASPALPSQSHPIQQSPHPACFRPPPAPNLSHSGSIESTGGSNSTGWFLISRRNRCCAVVKSLRAAASVSAAITATRHHQVRLLQRLTRPELLLVKLCRRIEVIGSKVRRKGKRQPQPPRQLRTESARPQQRNRHVASLPRNRLHRPAPASPDPGSSQFLQQLGKIIPALPRIPPQCPAWSGSRPGSPSPAPGRCAPGKGPPASKLFRHHQRCMVGQHHFPPLPTRIVFVAPAMCPINTAVAAQASPAMA